MAKIDTDDIISKLKKLVSNASDLSGTTAKMLLEKIRSDNPGISKEAIAGVLKSLADYFSTVGKLLAMSPAKGMIDELQQVFREAAKQSSEE